MTELLSWVNVRHTVSKHFLCAQRHTQKKIQDGIYFFNVLISCLMEVVWTCSNIKIQISFENSKKNKKTLLLLTLDVEFLELLSRSD